MLLSIYDSYYYLFSFFYCMTYLLVFLLNLSFFEHISLYIIVGIFFQLLSVLFVFRFQLILNLISVHSFQARLVSVFCGRLRDMYMCVYMYIYTHICIFVYIHIYRYILRYVYIYIYIHIYILISIYIYMYFIYMNK